MVPNYIPFVPHIVGMRLGLDWWVRGQQDSHMPRGSLWKTWPWKAWLKAYAIDYRVPKSLSCFHPYTSLDLLGCVGSGEQEHTQREGRQRKEAERHHRLVCSPP